MRLALQSVTEQLATLRGGSDHTGTATGRHNNRRASATTSSSAAPALTAPPPGTMLTEHTMVAEEEDLPTEVVLVRDATGRDRTEADNAAAAGTGVIRVDSHRIDRP